MRLTDGVTRVDLHCHSTFSDGTLTPEQLADRLADAGVVVAALTDHDTLEGLARFRVALDRHQIPAINGIELTTRDGLREVHLLAFGFDPAHKELLATLASLHLAREDGMHSVAQALRQRELQSGTSTDTVPSAAPQGRLNIGDAIALVHRAGGRAFLAHPLLYEPTLDRLVEMARRLQGLGLDGIEVFYAAFTPQQQESLRRIAHEFGLLSCGGVDQHQPVAPGLSGFGIDMPTPAWKQFREAVVPGVPHGAGATRTGSGWTAQRRRKQRQFAFHIILPTLLAIVLFVGALFALLLPEMERALLDRKREMIRELTNSAWSILAEAEKQVQSGQITRNEAQQLAKARIQTLRYGREGKDYFWLQDLTPRILMHPYRPELDGQDVSEFRDARGARIFVEFADLVRRREEGYIEYVWQWKDDPQRVVAKESYIRGFTPWGWIIGTGIYIGDVQQEIARIESNFVRTSIAITVAVVLLLLYVMRESLRLERERFEAEVLREESTERYRMLVETTTEGTLLLEGNRCRYANPILLEMLGYVESDIALRDIVDVLPRDNHNASAWNAIENLADGGEQSEKHAGALRRRDGSAMPCHLKFRRIAFFGRAGLILLVAPISEGITPPSAHKVFVDRLLQLPGIAADDIAREIADAPDIQQVIACCNRTGGLVRSLLDCGAHPRHIARMLALICDATTQRLVAIACRDLGTPPVPYVFMALGSQGRQEQTLVTDQDNAIIYLVPDDGSPLAKEASTYFLELGTRVCAALDQAGYHFCNGDVMARNPRWCQPLARWQSYFDLWISKAEPQELLELSIFFDFRAVCGDEDIARRLRTHVFERLQSTPGFFPHFARNSLLFKPPLGLFGQIVFRQSEHPGMLDIKAAMMPLVNYARIYALRHGLRETNTIDRLAALARMGVLLDSTCHETTIAYEALMRLRLCHQSDAFKAGNTPDNLLDPVTLGHIEKAVLTESFAEIDAIQKRLSQDFLGGI